MPKAVERMSRVDTAWLRMDTDANLMMIVGVWVIEPGIAYDDLCRRVEERLLKYARFRQKVVEDPMGASWVLDEQFDLHRHVIRETLPSRRGRDPKLALQARVGELAAQPMDTAHPLWEFRLIEDYDGGPVGVETLAAALGEPRDTIEDVYEPYLLQQGFLGRTPRGRVATRKAYAHLKVPFVGPPAKQPDLFDAPDDTKD